MKRLGNHDPKPADKPENGPSNLADEIPQRQDHPLELRDFIAAGFTGMYHSGGQSMDSWRLQRCLDRDGAAT